VTVLVNPPALTNPTYFGGNDADPAQGLSRHDPAAASLQACRL
jgi:hypothetical protein